MTPVPFEVLDEPLAVCRLDPGATIPAWATERPFFSICRTSDELSVICASSLVPAEVTAGRGWRAIKLRGPFDLTLVGLMLSVARPLAAVGVSMMPVATYDTDYVLVPGAQLAAAIRALRGAGHTLERPVKD